MDDELLAHASRPLSGPDLALEPIQPHHAALLFESMQHAGLYVYIPVDAPASVAALEQRYARWARRRSTDGGEIWLNYAIYQPSLQRYLGTLQATVYRDGPCDIAYEIFPAYWRRRHAFQACGILIEHLFSHFPIPAIRALVDTRNRPSWKLLEALGFQRREVIVQADHFKGASSDEYRYELVRPDACGAARTPAW